jgi:hypothetical protein
MKRTAVSSSKRPWAGSRVDWIAMVFSRLSSIDEGAKKRTPIDEDR